MNFCRHLSLIKIGFFFPPSLDVTEHAEADTFFCFTGLMSEIRDFFIKTLDESEMGINGLMSRLMRKLKECDPQVWNRLKNQELEPQFYSFR